MQSFQFQMFDLAVTLNYVKVSGNQYKCVKLFKFYLDAKFDFIMFKKIATLRLNLASWPKTYHYTPAAQLPTFGKKKWNGRRRGEAGRGRYMVHSLLNMKHTMVYTIPALIVENVNVTSTNVTECVIVSILGPINKQ